MPAAVVDLPITSTSLVASEIALTLLALDAGLITVLLNVAHEKCLQKAEAQAAAKSEIERATVAIAKMRAEMASFSLEDRTSKTTTDGRPVHSFS